MEKKEYKKPIMKEIELESTDIIADSGSSSTYDEIEINNTPNRGPWG